jgi:small subunit ribosomal protein S16
MLAIRLQRTGRKGHAQFRIVVQDSRRTPQSGRVVKKLGHFNPHTKEVVIDKEKAAFYLENGAQPSERVVKLFKAEKVTIPSWVKESTATAKRSVKNPDKLRKNRPAEPEASAPAGTPATADTEAPETADDQAETPTEE